VLTESAAILIHLGLSLPAANLLPQAPTARAQAIRGLVFIAANCYAAISIIDFPQRWCADADTDKPVQQRIIDGTRARLHQHWNIFAEQFYPPTVVGQLFLNGSEPGALDLLAGVVSRWSGARTHLLASRPDFHALLQRIDQHPRLLPVFSRHWPAQ